MALTLVKSTRKEVALQKQNAALTERLHARISTPIVQDFTTFVGFGDSANAQALLEAVTGSSAAAIRVIRQRVEGLQRGVFLRRFQDGDFVDTPAFDHPLQRLLDHPTRNEKGESSHSARQFFGMTVTQHQAVGESYWFVLHDGLGIPRQLQMARPGTVTPVLGNGVITGYKVFGVNGERPLRAVDVVRFWEPDPFDLFEARGVMGKSRDIIEMDTFSQKRWAKFYQNDATPKLAFEAMDANANFPTSDQQEEVARTWAQRFNRLVGKWKLLPAWVMPGWKVHQLTSEDEAGSGITFMTSARRWVFQQFGVPTSLVGDIVDVNRAAAETTRFSFDQNTVEPITVMIDDALTSQLASQYPVGEGVQLIVKHRPFKSEDKEFNLKRDTADLLSKTRSINEVRSQREPEMPPVLWGDLPVGSFNDVPYDGTEEELDLSGIVIEPTAAASEEEEEERERRRVDLIATRMEKLNANSHVTRKTLKSLRAHFSKELEWERQLLRDQQFTPKFRIAQRTVFRRQAEETVKAFLALPAPETRAAATSLATNLSEAIVEQTFLKLDWRPLYEKSTKPVRDVAYRASASSATEAIIGRSFNLTKASAEALREMNLTHVKFTNEATARRLVEQIASGLDLDETPGQIARRITDVFGQRRKDATRIARTEIASAVSDAQIAGYKQTGVVEKKQWNTSLDADVRDDHQIEGQTRGLDDDFDVGGEPANAPADTSLSAGNRINCRCFVTPVFIDEETGTS